MRKAGGERNDPADARRCGGKKSLQQGERRSGNGRRQNGGGIVSRTAADRPVRIAARHGPVRARVEALEYAANAEAPDVQRGGAVRRHELEAPVAIHICRGDARNRFARLQMMKRSRCGKMDKEAGSMDADQIADAVAIEIGVEVVGPRRGRPDGEERDSEQSSATSAAKQPVQHTSASDYEYSANARVRN